MVNMKPIYWRYGIFLNILLGLVLRLYHLGVRDFWYDEAFSGIAVKEGWGRMMEILVADTHPPLYYLGLKAWGFLFNYSVYGLRLFSVLWGMLAIYFAYLILRQVAGVRAAWFGSFLIAINPFALQYSQETRMYAMLGTLLLGTTYFFFKARKEEKIRDYVLFGVFYAAALLTHYFAFIFGAVLLIWLIYDLMLKSKFTLGRFFKEVGNLVVNKKIWLSVFTIVLIFAFWWPNFLEQWQTQDDKIDWISKPEVEDMVYNLEIFLIGSPAGMAGVPEPNGVRGIREELLVILVIAFAGVILISFIIKDNPLAWYFVIGSLGYLLITYLLSYLDLYYLISRYLIGAGYLFLILFGLWVSNMKTRWAIGVLIAYLSLVFLIDYPKPETGYNVLKRQETEYRDNTFYVLDTFQYVITKYYFGFDKVILFNAPWPEYNPKDWLGVNGEIKRAVRWEEVEEDPKGIVVWNKEAVPKLNYDYMFFDPLAVYDNLHLLKARAN